MFLQMPLRNRTCSLNCYEAVKARDGQVMLDLTSLDATSCT